jgi:hypothetical protein
MIVIGMMYFELLMIAVGMIAIGMIAIGMMQNQVTTTWVKEQSTMVR